MGPVAWSGSLSRPGSLSLSKGPRSAARGGSESPGASPFASLRAPRQARRPVGSLSLSKGPRSVARGDRAERGFPSLRSGHLDRLGDPGQGTSTGPATRGRAPRQARRPDGLAGEGRFPELVEGHRDARLPPDHHGTFVPRASACHCRAQRTGVVWRLCSAQVAQCTYVLLLSSLSVSRSWHNQCLQAHAQNGGTVTTSKTCPCG